MKSKISQNELLSAIEDQLAADVKEMPCDGSIVNAIHYALIPGGKRIRPRLAMTVCADFGVNPLPLVYLFTPLEFVHISSLIHDDLPALDNDDYRRGRLSCHKQFNEATAILGGDLMISYALSRLANAKFDAESKLSLVAELSMAFVKLCQGQQYDLDGVHGAEVLKTHSLKTGALFGAVCASGAIAAGQSKDIIECLRSLGVAIGVYFQAIDDYKDNFEYSNRDSGGEGSDQRNHRHTVVTEFAQTADSLLLQLRKAIDTNFSELSGICHNRYQFTGMISVLEEIELSLAKTK